MMFDATDLEIARREHDAEMGGDSATDRSWYFFFAAVETMIRARGYVRHGGSAASRADTGLDGNEADGEPSDGYSIDGAYEAWERRQSAHDYFRSICLRRVALGLTV